MDLDKLKQLGAIVSPEPVAKDVEWRRKGANGKMETLKFKIHVVRYAFADAERISELSGKEDQSQAAYFIHTTIRLGDDGTERISYEDAKRLDPGLAAVFTKAILEVNASASKNV